MYGKYIGICLIIGASLYISYCIKRFGENKINCYCAICDLIEYIKDQIEYFCTPTEGLIGSYSNDFLYKSGFLRNLEKNDWKKAIENDQYLDQYSKTVLEDFSKKLGKSSREQQIANCEYVISALSRKYEICKEDVSKRFKAYSTLAVIVGFMFVILVI